MADIYKQATILDHGYVELKQAWGSDEDIIAAARQSTDGQFRGWGPLPCPECEKSETPGTLWDGTVLMQCANCKGTGKIPGDERLLKYLYEHRHATPFEMAGLTVEVQAPIFVFRQWQRHRTQSYNEMSGRYTQLPEMCYVPTIERLRASAAKSTNKQARGGGELSTNPEVLQKDLRRAYKFARNTYEMHLRAGVSDELARIVLPVAQYSRMWASAKLRNWLEFMTLRCDEHAQWETRQYAWAVADLVEQLFPRTYDLWNVDGPNLKRTL